jgi:hypothetical protein
MSDIPSIERTDPAEQILEAVESCLRLAATWVHWDGNPKQTEEGPWTPHKAIRRIADHLIDHLAQSEALLAGEAGLPDTWGGRRITLASDLASFGEADLNEARARLRRLAQTFALRLRAAEAVLDQPANPGWSLREIATHVSEVTWYAEQVGDLAPERQQPLGFAEGLRQWQAACPCCFSEAFPHGPVIASPVQ